MCIVFANYFWKKVIAFIFFADDEGLDNNNARCNKQAAHGVETLSRQGRRVEGGMAKELSGKEECLGEN